MIENLFQKSKPSFISIQGETFVIGEKKVQAIDGFIHDLQPLRKFFFTGKLLCYSYDNTTGKNGKYCAFCRNQFRCQKRLRLMIYSTRGEIRLFRMSENSKLKENLIRSFYL